MSSKIDWVTNIYAQDNWNNSKVREIKENHILQFLVVYFYIGIVYLPAKSWKQGWVWLAHLVTWGMIRGMFEFIFRYFHVSYDGNNETNEADEDGADEDGADEDGADDDDDNNDDDDDDDNNMMEKKGKRVIPMMLMTTQMVTIVDQKNLHKTPLVTKRDDVEVEEENNVEGVAQEIIVNVW